jgi:hypothetical protein
VAEQKCNPVQCGADLWITAITSLPPGHFWSLAAWSIRRPVQHLVQVRQHRCATRRQIAPTDLIVSIVTDGPEDWCFGLGRAQFFEGDL